MPDDTTPPNPAGNGNAPPEALQHIQLPKSARFVILVFDGDAAACAYSEGGPDGQGLLAPQLFAAAKILDAKADLVARDFHRPAPGRILVPGG